MLTFHHKVGSTSTHQLCLYFQFLYQRTPLHVAVEEGGECTVESLVENFKADINSKDSDGVSKVPAFTYCLQYVQFHYIYQFVTQTENEFKVVNFQVF